MIKNYLLVAFRNLFRNRISSIVNILALATNYEAFEAKIPAFVEEQIGSDMDDFGDLWTLLLHHPSKDPGDWHVVFPDSHPDGIGDYHFDCKFAGL